MAWILGRAMTTTNDDEVHAIFGDFKVSNKNVISDSSTSKAIKSIDVSVKVIHKARNDKELRIFSSNSKIDLLIFGPIARKAVYFGFMSVDFLFKFTVMSEFVRASIMNMV